MKFQTLHLSAFRKQDHKEEGLKEPLPFKFMLRVSLMLGAGFVMFATPICPILGPTGESLMLIGFAEIYQKEY